MPVKLESVTDKQDEQLAQPNGSLKVTVPTKVIKQWMLKCYPPTCRVPSITILIVTAGQSGLCEFSISRL